MSNRIEARTVAFTEALECRRLLAAGFQIQIVFDGDLVEPEYMSYQAAFTTAAARWTAVLTEDIPDVGSGAWGAAVDDLRITASASPIDGPNGVLGSAQIFYRRTTGAKLPINGLMNFDTADLSAARIVDVITHEMGHILGIGSLWAEKGLVNDYGGSNPSYTGAAALAELRAYTGNPAITAIPVENTGALGTRDVHWRETTFARELMTGYYNTGVINPLSRMSLAALIDLGYPGVNLDAADAYSYPSNPIPTIVSLTASSPTSGVGGSFTLTANGVADTTGGVANVRFYRETNGIPGLQASGNVSVKDELITTDTLGPTWSAEVALGSLPPGEYTYYAQVSDAHNAVSTVVSTTHTISAAPAVPSAPDLASSSDTGASDSDNITAINLPTLNGTSTDPAGTVIRIFRNGIDAGTTTVASDHSWSFTFTTPLANGTHTLTAVGESGSSVSAASAPLTITVDTVAPVVQSSAFVYATLLGVQFQFSENVSGSLQSGDVTFTNTTTPGTFASTFVGSATNLATFKFAAFPPPKGDYTATLIAAGVTDLAGNTMAANATVNFFYLPGDIDQSRSVTFSDLLIVAQHYGQAGTFAQGDLNYSGTIDFADLLLLAQNYGQTLAIAATTSSTSNTKKRGGSAGSLLA